VLLSTLASVLGSRLASGVAWPQRRFELLVLAASTCALVAVTSACTGSSSGPQPAAPIDDAGGVLEGDAADAGESDAGESDAADAADAFVPTGKCADTFGTKLTAGFGRADGIVYAVQKPSDTSCVMPNRDHVIVQVLIESAVYRMVVNVQSDRAGADPKIRVATLPHALPAPAFAEGWHLGAPLDYVTSLGAHADASFTPLTLDDATAKIASEVKVGDPIAVYAESGAGRPESAHLVHRNKTNQDGALVVSPTTQPRFLLFHFDGQTF
jgi:hypothetical protein